MFFIVEAQNMRSNIVETLSLGKVLIHIFKPRSMLRIFYSVFPATILRHRNMMVTDVEVDYEYLEQIDKARIDFRDLIISKYCAPIMLRLAWQDAATYDEGTITGGPNGSIRFEEEYSQPINKGLNFALDLCEEVKSKYPKITYADLYQLAGVVAVEVTGGPKITFTPGRTDSTSSHREWSRLPSPRADADHLRLVFNRMGFFDREIVALSVVHTLGKARRDRSGYEGPWTYRPLKFDNSYFVALTDLKSDGLLRLPINNVFIQDPLFHQYVLRYAQDINYFFECYAEAHSKFSELGYAVVPQENLSNNSLLLLTAAILAVGAHNYFCRGRKKPK